MTSSPFLNDIRRFMRTRGYSLRIEKTCVYWIRFFIRYQKRRHPKEMGFIDAQADKPAIEHVVLNLLDQLPFAANTKY
ncbi:hypothetical protein [Oceanobacter sp. 3_MG-2023]|uniref:hypothetical protein n=1 Tax=Oceanobacter sp. 3_MG-2023 TaxID=3062622 RepID=UPI00351F473D